MTLVETPTSNVSVWPIRIAKGVLVISLLSLAGVGVLQLRTSSTPGRADLVGSSTTPHLNDHVDTSLRNAKPADETASGPAVVEPGSPTRISVPSLDIDALVLPSGIADDGAMEIPDEIAAGWFRLGPKPGSTKGSAVIVGHVDHREKPGVFFSLRRLELGEELFVTDSGGKNYHYRVTERYQVDKDELPVDTLFQRDGDPVLTLITCGGTFNPSKRHYADNIIIRAVPVDSSGSPLPHLADLS